jgi:uncharacterized protein (DUF58 family)
VTALLLGLGIYKNINLLALLGCVLLALLATHAFVVGRGLLRLQVDRRLDELLFAGAAVPIELRVRNLGARACEGARLEDAGQSWYIERLEGGARHACPGVLTLPGRGWHDLGPILLSSSHPFGLVRRQVAAPAGGRILVLPRPARLDRERLRHQLRGADPRGERIKKRGWRHDTAQADFHGLRPFRPGDSPRWIHWRTSARRGELMVREFEDVPGDDLLVVLPACSGNDVERVIGLAASIVWEWCRRRGDRLALLAGDVLYDGLTGPEHVRLLLGALAVLPAHALPAPDLDLVRELPATMAVVALHAGRPAEAAALETVLARPVTPLDVAELEAQSL